jgi:hypothetical protein
VTIDESVAVDLRAVWTWMDRESLGDGPISQVLPIGGGTQNVMIRFARNGRPFVLRRGPIHELNWRDSHA